VKQLTGIALGALLGLAACKSPEPRQTTAGRPCEALAALSLPDSVISAATLVPAGGFVPDGPAPAGIPASLYQTLPAFCRVEATITPVPDSRIGFEVWMPAAGWNGKLMGTGNGGAQGAIFHFAMAVPLQRGYAVANTDTGHTGDGADWSFAVGHPEKLTDYAWRAVHEMTVRAKLIIEAHYGSAPRLSYWTGCSSGGRQGLMEAQRFPADYDGIIAGAPANAWVPLMAHTLLVQRAMTDPAGKLPLEKLPVLREAAIAACDAADGVVDRVAEDPSRCEFDPGSLRCARGDGPTCLTDAQIELARRVYRGASNPRTGAPILPGPEPASEREWAAYSGAFPIGANYFRDLIFGDPRWDPLTFDFDADVARASRLEAGQIDATDPDLGAFAARGGRLLLWHGWSDGLIPPGSTIQYYRAVAARLGADAARDHVRLFMAPGVDHCWGGEGPYEIDALSALERWVEQGEPPERVLASRPLDGGGARSRPLCPYPQIARYGGSGSSDDHASFECAAP
jgi:feruloyl esterase